MSEKLRHLMELSMRKMINVANVVHVCENVTAHIELYTTKSFLTGFETQCTHTNYDKTLQLAMLTVGMSSLCIATVLSAGTEYKKAIAHFLKKSCYS